MTTLEFPQATTGQTWNWRDILLTIIVGVVVLAILSLWPVISLGIGITLLLLWPKEAKADPDRVWWCLLWLGLGVIGIVYPWAALNYAHHMPLIPMLLLALPYVAVLAGLFFALYALGQILDTPGYNREIDN